jgi:hypothetical protein
MLSRPPTTSAQALTARPDALAVLDGPHLVGELASLDPPEGPGHVRRAVVPQKVGGPPFIATFDFAQAAEWDLKGTKTGTDRSNVEELELLLNHTIDKLLAEPFKKE